MEEGSDYETETFELVMAAGNLTMKQKQLRRAEVSHPAIMKCWNLKGDNQRLTVENRRWLQRHAHWRGQPSQGQLPSLRVRLPRLKSNTFPMYPTGTNGFPSFAASYAKSRDEEQVEHVGSHSHKMSLAFEMNELKRRIEEEKRKKRELQRSFELAMTQHQQRRLQDVRCLEKERQRLREAVHQRVKTQQHLTKMLHHQQGLCMASPSIVRLQNAKAVAEHQGEIIAGNSSVCNTKTELQQTDTGMQQTNPQWKQMKRLTRKMKN